MSKSILVGVTWMILCCCYSALASAATKYEFCVDRQSDTKTETIHARVKFGDIDPGKEVARVVAAYHYKQANTTNVNARDYSVAACGRLPIVDEINITATGEQLTTLGQQIASGQVDAAAVTAMEIYVGVTVAEFEAVGNALVSAAKKIPHVAGEAVITGGDIASIVKCGAFGIGACASSTNGSGGGSSPTQNPRVHMSPK